MPVLHADYDDPADPTELTLYPPAAAARATRWLTIDVDHAIELRSMV